MKNLNLWLFIPSLCLVFLIVILSITVPEATSSTVGAAKNWITHQMGWFIEIVSLGYLLFLLWFAFSRYGGIKFINKTDTRVNPSFSNSAYAFMIFTAGAGSSLIFWAMAEPIYYFSAPPLFAQKHSFIADQWLMTYTMFHWGFTGWAIYTFPGLPFAYFLYNRGKQNLKLSQLCSVVIGQKNAGGFVGWLIDIVAIFATLGAFSSSLGLAIDVLSAGLADLFGWQINIGLQTSIIIGFVLSLAGIMIVDFKKGVSTLSNYTVYIAFGFGIIIAIMSGKVTFIMDYFTDSLGVMLDNYFRMSLWTDPVQKSNFPQDWTMYYWTWYFAYLIMMGLFLARISRGRTAKEMILYTIFFGFLGCAFFISIFGGFAISNIITNKLPLIQWIKDYSPGQMIIKIMHTLPMSNWTISIFLIMEFLLMLTTMISATVAITMMSSKRLTIDGETDNKVKLIWAVGIGAVTLSIFLSGGSINTIKALCIITGFPMIFVYLILTKAMFV